MESQCSSDLHFSKGWKNWSIFTELINLYWSDFIWLNALTYYTALVFSIYLLYSVKGTVYKHLLPVWWAVSSWTVCPAVKMLFRFPRPDVNCWPYFLGNWSSTEHALAPLLSCTILFIMCLFAKECKLYIKRAFLLLSQNSVCFPFSKLKNCVCIHVFMCMYRHMCFPQSLSTFIYLFVR